MGATGIEPGSVRTRIRVSGPGHTNSAIPPKYKLGTKLFFLRPSQDDRAY